jgi:hypothetical protein
LSSSHQIGIWDTTPQHNLLASATVSPIGSVDIGGFWYVNIAPLTLSANTIYMIGARYSDNDFDFARGNATTLISANGVVIKDAFLSTGIGFEFPDLNVSGANLGFFGPNAGFEAVPEPAMTALAMGLGLVALIVYKRRHVRLS